MHTPSLSKPAENDGLKHRAEALAARSSDRQSLLERLQDEDAVVHWKRLEKCGSKMRLKCTCCRAVKTVELRCDLKWCPACAPRLAFDRSAKYAPIVNEFHHPLFVTFTTQNFDARSKKTTGMREVIRAFKRLRCQRWWRRCCCGGVAGFEMTRRKKGWHPHAHCLLDSAWFAATITRPPIGTPADKFRARALAACREIAEQWTMALGGRPGTVKVRKVHVRQGETVADSLREVIKYSVTAESLRKMSGKLGLFLDELSVSRNLVGFGSAYRHPALKKISREGQPCPDCGELKTMLPESLCDRFMPRDSPPLRVQTNAERKSAANDQRRLL